MLAEVWIDLLHKIPLMEHDGLVLVTTAKTEIKVQSIVRTEVHYLVILGRLMGTTDQAGMFFVPFDQVDCLVYNRMIKEAELHAWFGGPPGTVPAPAPVVVQAAPPPPPRAVPAPPPPMAIPAGPAIPATAMMPMGSAPAAPPPQAIPVAPAAASAQPLQTQTRSGNIPLPGKAAILERLRKRGPNPGASPDSDNAPATPDK